MNDMAGWAEPHTATLFLNSDSGLLEKIPAGGHWEEAAAAGTCSMFYPKHGWNMFKVNISLNLEPIHTNCIGEHRPNTLTSQKPLFPVCVVHWRKWNILQ